MRSGSNCPALLRPRGPDHLDSGPNHPGVSPGAGGTSGTAGSGHPFGSVPLLSGH